MAKATTAINHYNGVRLRVLGEGDLRMRFLSMSESIEQVLVPLTMETATARLKNKLANFKSESAQLEIKVTEIDEWFHIERIIIFAKPIYQSYPQ